MKKIINNIILLIIIALCAFACTEDYLTDGGIAKAETELTVYDYLKANRYDMFDTLVQIIDSLELEETINSAGTFFAPTDYSIQLYLESMTDTLVKYTEVSDILTYTLKHLFNDLEQSAMLQYVIDDAVCSLKNATLKWR